MEKVITAEETAELERLLGEAELGPHDNNTALIIFLRKHAPALLAAACQAEAKDARIAELEAALRPFARLAASLDTKGREPGKFWIMDQHVRTVAARLADPSPNAGGGDAE